MLQRFSDAFNKLVVYNVDESTPSLKTNQRYKRVRFGLGTYLSRALMAARFQYLMATSQENLDYYLKQPDWYLKNESPADNKFFSLKFLIELIAALGFKLVDSAFKLPRLILAKGLDWTAAIRRQAWKTHRGLGLLASIVCGVVDLVCLHLPSVILFIANEATQLALDFVRGIINAILSPYSSMVKPFIQQWHHSGWKTRVALVGLMAISLFATLALIAASFGTGGAILAPFAATVLLPAFKAVAAGIGAPMASIVFAIGAIILPPVICNGFVTMAKGLRTTWNNVKALAKEMWYHAFPSLQKGESKTHHTVFDPNVQSVNVESKVLSKNNMTYLETQTALAMVDSTSKNSRFYEWEGQSDTPTLCNATSALLFNSHLRTKPTYSKREGRRFPMNLLHRPMGAPPKTRTPLFDDSPADKAAIENAKAPARSGLLSEHVL